MFGAVYKNGAFFEINCGNCQFKFTSFSVQDQLILEIEIQDHPWTHFDTTNSMEVLESQNEFLLEIMFFKVSSFILIYVKP